MEESTASFGQLAAASKEVTRRLLTIGENRLELFTVEVQEERERLLRAFLLALGVAAFGLLAGLTLTAAIVVLLWDHSHAATLLVLTLLYGAVGVYLCLRLSGLLRDWQTLSASLEQLRKDRACLEKILAWNALESRKQLLVAESELNRAQLVGDLAAVTAGVCSIRHRAKSYGSIAFSATALLAGLLALRKSKRADAAAKPCLLQTILKGAGLVSTLWAAFPPRRA